MKRKKAEANLLERRRTERYLRDRLAWHLRNAEALRDILERLERCDSRHPVVDWTVTMGVPR